ncbi:MAG: peroxiredoxin Q/BCP [Acidimicrobiales bacterium]
MLGISFDVAADNLAFAEKLDFPFRLLADPQKVAGAAYQVLRDPDDKFANFSQRHSYLIDPGGKIAKAYEVADPSAHALEVMADLATLKA